MWGSVRATLATQRGARLPVRRPNRNCSMRGHSSEPTAIRRSTKATKAARTPVGSGSSATRKAPVAKSAGVGWAVAGGVWTSAYRCPSISVTGGAGGGGALASSEVVVGAGVAAVVGRGVAGEGVGVPGVGVPSWDEAAEAGAGVGAGAASNEGTRAGGAIAEGDVSESRTEARSRTIDIAKRGCDTARGEVSRKGEVVGRERGCTRKD